MLKLTATEIKKLKELGIELKQKQFDQATELVTFTGGLKLSVYPETERPFVLTDGDINYTSVTLKSLLAFYETLDYIKIENVALKAEEELVQSKQDELELLKHTYNQLFENYKKLESDFENDEGEYARAYKTLKEEHEQYLNCKTPQPKPLNWVQRLFDWF